MNRGENIIAKVKDLRVGLVKLEEDIKAIKFALVTAGCIIFTLICVIIYLLG